MTVDLEAHRWKLRAQTFTDQPALAGTQADRIDVAVRQRAQVRRRMPTNGDALRLEAGWEARFGPGMVVPGRYRLAEHRAQHQAMRRQADEGWIESLT
jgi:hypothetical protein